MEEIAIRSARGAHSVWPLHRRVWHTNGSLVWPSFITPMLSPSASGELDNSEMRKLRAAACGVVITVEANSGEHQFPFPADTQSILVGRGDGWANVITPVDDRRVSRKHLELRRQVGGEWEVVPLGDNYVAVNGRAVKGVRHIADGDRLVLGKADGLGILFRLVPPASDSDQRGLDTELQDKPKDWEDELRRRLLMVGGAIAVLFAVIGALGWLIYDQKSDIAGLMAEQETRASEAPVDWSRATIDKVELATFLIVAKRDGQEWGVATAWRVAQYKLVTNAHVVAELCGAETNDAIFVCRAKGIELLVRNKERDTYQVEGAELHPGYSLLRDAVADRRVGTTALDGSFRLLGLPRGYDLAVLTLESGAGVGPTLNIADGLNNSLKGRSVGFAGFLLDGTLQGSIAHINPTPSLRFGTISDVTSYFLSWSEHRGYLLQNTVPITGGSSGGAMFDREGNVVGIISSGTVVTIPPTGEDGKATKVPNAALVNYAQRADVLKQMLGSGSTFDAERAATEWSSELDRFTDYRAYALQQFRDEAKRYDDRGFRELQPVRNIRAGPGLQTTQTTVDVSEGRIYAIMAYSETADPVWVRAKVDGRVVEARSDTAKLFIAPAATGKLALELVTNSETDAKLQLYLFASP